MFGTGRIWCQFSVISSDFFSIFSDNMKNMLIFRLRWQEISKNSLHLRVHYLHYQQNTLLVLLNHQQLPFHAILQNKSPNDIWVFCSHLCKFANRYHCLTWDAAPLLKVLMVLKVLEVRWFYKNDMKIQAVLGMIEIIRNDDNALLTILIYPCMSFKQSSLTVIPILHFLKNSLAVKYFYHHNY